jgi:hypothetical protein
VVTRESAAARRAGALALAALLAATSAVAQSPPSGAAGAAGAPGSGGAAELATARALGVEGVKLADANNCAEAVPKLERAERLHHAPTTLGRLGECHVQLGALVLGTELLQRVVRETLPPNSPQVFALAKARAQKVLDQALPKIGKLRVTVKAPPDAHPSITIDGEPLSPAMLDVDRPTDPGQHHVEANAAGYRGASATVTLREGGAEAVSLALESSPNAPRPEAPVVAPGPAAGAVDVPAPAAPSPPPPGHSNALAYALLGVGTAGVIAGSVLGGLTLAKASDLSERCPNKQCATERARDDLSAAERTGTWSTVAFGVGGAGLVAGVVLLLTAPRGVPRDERRAALRPRFGLGSLGVEGTF